MHNFYFRLLDPTGWLEGDPVSRSLLERDEHGMRGGAREWAGPIFEIPALSETVPTEV